MTIRELHRLAYPRMPRGEVHARLHEQAVAMGAPSLKDLLPHQLDELARHVRALPIQHGEKPARPRRGRPRRDGVIPMISNRQLAFIQILRAEIGWSVEQLAGWLRAQFGVSRPPELGTASAGVECIRRLRAVKADRRRRRGTGRCF